MRIALIADWLTTFGGAERALAELHALWPHSPLYTTVARDNVLPTADVRTSRLQAAYRLIGRHQLLLPWMPRAVEDLDLRGYDVIVSSSHAVGKGIIPPGNAVHICYCHTPMRYAWEMEQQYLEDFRVPQFLRKTVRKALGILRRWDLSTAKRVDAFIANSSETAGRIERIYGRTATVIPPPAHDRFFATPLVPTEKRSGFLAIGRLVPYKRFDLAIACANALRFPLTIAGAGQEEKRLRAMAGPTVTFVGRVSDDDLPALYAHAKAVFFPTYEDAGIVPIEAQACGTPVIALGKGGALDTVVDGKTGLFFTQQSPQSLQSAVERFSTMLVNPAAIRAHAQQFSSEKFRQRVDTEVKAAVLRYRREAVS